MAVVLFLAGGINKKCVAVSNATEEEQSKPWDTRHRATGFGVYPDGLHSGLGPGFPPMPFFLIVGTLMYFLCCCGLEIWNLLLISQGVHLKDCLESQKRQWTLDF